jgi:hypothetical protein
MMSQAENLYKVILPFNSHLVHSSSSINGGASKCYKEIKNQMGGVDLFAIMNINSNKVYNFQTKSNNNLNKNSNNTMNINNSNQNGGFISNLNEIRSMNEQIKMLESRIISLENISNKITHHTTMEGGLNKEEVEIKENKIESRSDLEVFSKLNLESKQKKLIESLKIL